MPTLAVKKQQKILDDIDAQKKRAADKMVLLKCQVKNVEKKRKLDTSSSSTTTTSIGSPSPLASSSPKSRVEIKDEDLALLNDESFISQLFDEDKNDAMVSLTLPNEHSVSSLFEQRTPNSLEASGEQKSVANSSSQSTSTLNQQSTEIANQEISKPKKTRITPP